MATRVERILVAYALMGEKIQGADMYEGLWDFVRPYASQHHGERFIPQALTSWIAETYALKMPVVVMEGLCERMVKAGLLAPHAQAAGAASYFYLRQPEQDILGSDASTTISEALAAFSAFIHQNAPEIAKGMSEEALEAEFFDRLLNIESLSILSQRDGQVSPKATPTTLMLRSKQEEPKERTREQHIDYVFSRFLVELRDEQGTLFEIIARIADTALVSEALLTYREPPKRGEALSGLEVYVDGPLCLDILGVNVGREDFGQDFVQLLQNSGAQLFVFHHTVLEVERILEARKTSYVGAPLYPSERTTEPPVTRERVRALAGYSEQFLHETYKFTIADGSSAVPGAVRQRVGAQEEQSVRLKLRNPSQEALETDVTTACELMRIRSTRGVPTRLAEAGPILVTRNPVLLGVTNGVWRDHLRDSNRATADRLRKSAPLAISERFMCGIAWITSGGTLGEISRKRLIANCAAATSTRRDVIARVLNILSEKAPQDQDMFRAVMADQRAERTLMNLTRGDPYVVSSDNVFPMLEAVKEATAHEISIKKDAEISRLQGEHDQELLRRSKEARESQDRAMGLELQLQELRIAQRLERGARRERGITLMRSVVREARLIYWGVPIALGIAVALLTLVVQVEALAWPAFGSSDAWKTWVVPGAGLLLPNLLLAWDIPDKMFGRFRTKLCYSYVAWRCKGTVAEELIAEAVIDYRTGAAQLQETS